MSDRWTILLALATVGGAYVARPAVPFGVALVAALLAVAVSRPTRAPVLLCAALAILTSVLGARSWRGLDVDGAFATPLARGWATLVTDPRDLPGGGVQADLRLRGKRLRATARSPAVASSLRQRLAGEQLHIEGEVRRLEPDARARLAGRHIAGRLTVTTIHGWRAGTPLARMANALRRTIVAGAASLPTNRRALYAGVVLGDDREQDTAEVEDFRASGLTHLLAVSGQNVAFVLTLASPLLRRLDGRLRTATACIALVVFGAVTRWEPSVLRAVAMAVLAVWAVTNGRPATSVRLLALAVTALVLLDPMLVRSIGFLLSVSASAGIALLAPGFERVLPAPLAVTLAAQAGVAPVLLRVFDTMPLAALPANLLALPAAAPLMMWGVAAGLPAGVLGGVVAHLLHVPTHALLWWIATVARLGAALPLGRLTAASALAVLAAAMAAWLVGGTIVAAAVAAGPRRGAAWRLVPPVLPAVAGGTAMLLVALSPLATPGRPIDREPLTGDRGTSDRRTVGHLWRAGGHTIVVADVQSTAPPGQLLAALRARHVTSIDVLVVKARSRTAGESARAVAARVPVRLALAPTDRRYGLGRTPTIGLRPGVHVRAGPFTVTVTSTRTGPGKHEVQVASPRAPRARSP